MVYLYMFQHSTSKQVFLEKKDIRMFMNSKSDKTNEEIVVAYLNYYTAIRQSKTCLASYVSVDLLIDRLRSVE
jgi:hypothetical protein